MKTGLVLEGGGLRCMFTAGIIDVLLENDVQFDGVIGVSAGATFGCNYVSRQAGRVIRYQKQYIHDDRFMSWKSLRKTGDFVGAEFAYHVMPVELDVFDFDTFRNNPTEFYLVCADADKGTPVYRRIDKMDYEGLEWLRATASMPIVSRTVSLDGMRLLDGGIVDSIPLKQFQKIGFERNVVILSQPAGFRKRKPSGMPLLRLALRKLPAIKEAMARRHLMYNEQLDYIEEQERLGNILVIRPDAPLNIGRTERNEDKIQKVYDLGRAAGEKYLCKITQFIAK